MKQSSERLAVLARIADMERAGIFDRDAEIDPPTKPLCKGDVDYLGTHRRTRFWTRVANRLAKRHFDGCIDRGELIIKEIVGIDNYLSLYDRGVLLTCNHFNPYDNYAVYKAIEPYLGGHCLWKIIREGNYTNFPGFYGFLFRHCNTLPLAADLSVLRELLAATDTLLRRGERVLIYPEQAMWWNYRKPRPLKVGAFRFAARVSAPVCPVFIGQEDTDKLDADGFPIQAYTIHFLPAIFPDSTLSVRENSRMMCEKNYEAWETCYEQFYRTPLVYDCDKEVTPCSI